MSHTLLLRPENRCRHGNEPPPALHALRSEAFAEDLADLAQQPAPGGGTIRAPWWKKVFDAQVSKSRGMVGVAAGRGLGGRPA